MVASNLVEKKASKQAFSSIAVGTEQHLVDLHEIFQRNSFCSRCVVNMEAIGFYDKNTLAVFQGRATALYWAFGFFEGVSADRCTGKAAHCLFSRV